LFFVWPYQSTEPEFKDKFLVTKITGDLIDRMLTVAHAGISTIRRLKGQPPGVESLECDATSKRFIPYNLSDESQPNVVYVSLGAPTATAMPAGQATNWSMSLYVESQPSVSHLALSPGVRPPLAANSKWVQFADIGLQDPQRPFFCLTNVKLSQLHDLKAQLNNSDAGLFVFGMAFLREVFAEYAN